MNWLLQFKDCKDCPFYYERRFGVIVLTTCNLSERTFANGEKFPKLKPQEGGFPKGCPFEDYPHTIEVEGGWE